MLGKRRITVSGEAISPISPTSPLETVVFYELFCLENTSTSLLQPLTCNGPLELSGVFKGCSAKSSRVEIMSSVLRVGLVAVAALCAS